MESFVTLYRLFHCQQGPRPGPGMESFVTLYHLIHWRPRPGNPRRRRPNPDLNPAIRRPDRAAVAHNPDLDPDPDRAIRRWDRGTRAASAPDRDPDPERAIRRIPIAPQAPPTPIPIPVPPPAPPHIFFLTSWASRSSPPTPASDKFSIMDRISVTLM